jgi:branched-chain amino acid transport system ATP-binding protein
MTNKVLSLENVTIKFGGVVALNDVSFDIKEKEILGLIGPNGAGKTTVFNVITGVYQVTSGDIRFLGKSLKSKKRYKITKGGIARTFQNIRLWGDMTALENVITATDTHKRSGLLSGLMIHALLKRI